MKKRQILAGAVLTKNLINKLNDKAWIFGVRGHFEIIQEKQEKTTAFNIFDKKNREVVAIPKIGIKGNAEKFIADFEKTMASQQYKIQLI